MQVAAVTASRCLEPHHGVARSVLDAARGRSTCSAVAAAALAAYRATTTIRTTWMTQTPFSSFWPFAQSAARPGAAATWALAALSALGVVATADDETAA